MVAKEYQFGVNSASCVSSMYLYDILNNFSLFVQKRLLKMSVYKMKSMHVIAAHIYCNNIHTKNKEKKTKGGHLKHKDLKISF